MITFKRWINTQRFEFIFGLLTNTSEEHLITFSQAFNIPFISHTKWSTQIWKIHKVLLLHFSSFYLMITRSNCKAGTPTKLMKAKNMSILHKTSPRQAESANSTINNLLDASSCRTKHQCTLVWFNAIKMLANLRWLNKSPNWSSFKNTLHSRTHFKFPQGH